MQKIIHIYARNCITVRPNLDPRSIREVIAGDRLERKFRAKWAELDPQRKPTFSVTPIAT